MTPPAPKAALRLITILAATLCAGAAAAAAPSASAVPAIDQTLSAQRATTARLSPDGKWVVYGIAHADWVANSFANALWIVSTETGARRPLTDGKAWAGAPVWSPDSRRIAFLSDRDGATQAYAVAPEGGAAAKLTEVAGGIGSMIWSPDAQRIAFLADDPAPDLMKARRERYGGFRVEDSSGDGSVAEAAMTHIWIADAAIEGSGKPPAPARLTEGRGFSVNDIAWSPDGTRIAFAAVRDPGMRGRSGADIYLVEVASRKVTPLVTGPGPDVDPVWSPDGRQVAFSTSNGALNYFEANSYLAVVPAAGGAPRLLTRGIDEQPLLLTWGPKGIVFAQFEGVRIALKRLDPGSGKVAPIGPFGDLTPSRVSFTRDFERIGFLGQSATSHPEVYVSSTARPEPKRLTDFNAQFAGVRQARREVVSWTSSDGTKIEGVLISRPDVAASGPRPLLVVVHGGPADVDRPVLGLRFEYPIEQLAAKGALILEPNYRGSIGYGEAFRAPDPRTLSDYEDVASGVKSLVERGLADPERIGVMGWSQGGYLAALMATKGGRWVKAASVGAGVPDWLTYYSNSDAGYFAAEWFKATPKQDRAAYLAKSPVSYLDGAKTAVLIQHGENDRRAPIAGARAFYQALKDEGAPVRMITYEGAGHGIGTPKGQRALMEHNYDWFARWIWGEAESPPPH